MAGQYEQAERAYRQSLAIWVQQGNRAGEADSLNELGNLYNAMGRLEEAVTFYRQAVDIYVRLQNLIGEGRARNNLANTLIKLRRYDEARRELQRAIECGSLMATRLSPGRRGAPSTTWSRPPGTRRPRSRRANGRSPATWPTAAMVGRIKRLPRNWLLW